MTLIDQTDLDLFQCFEGASTNNDSFTSNFAQISLSPDYLDAQEEGKVA